MRRLLAILACTAGVAQAEPATPLEISATIHQGATLLTSPRQTTGGLGGGIGVEVAYHDRYLAQADIAALWMIGTPIATRIAAGAQRRGRWAAAAWITATAIWGSRIEIVTAPETRPAWPAWGIGLRVSPLRFRGALGTVSALEAGIASDTGSLMVELTVLRAGTTW